MIPKKAVHPGKMLLHEFMRPLGLSQAELARHIGVSPQTLGAVVTGRHGITPALAWKLAGAFGTSPQFWMTLQVVFDLAAARPRLVGPRLRVVRTGRAAVARRKVG